MENLNAAAGNEPLVPFLSDGDRVLGVVDTDRFATSGQCCETFEGSTATAPNVKNGCGLRNLDP